MIKLIGIGRLFFIVCLSALSALLIVYYHFTASPQSESSKKELAKNNSEISEISTNLADLKSGLETFKSQQEKFLSIKDQYDFFNAQDRVQARRKLNVIRDISRVSSAQYNIRPAVTEKNDALKESGYKVLNTPIEFNVTAIEDKDIYSFIYHLNYSFPGIVQIDQLSISRDEEITQPLLRDIGTGREDIRPLVSASIKTSWVTIVPDPSVSIKEGEGQ